MIVAIRIARAAGPHATLMQVNRRLPADPNMDE